MVSKKSINAKRYIFKKFERDALIYLAGIIDGEGCFHISILSPNKYHGYINPHFRGVLKISNTDKKLIDWLLQNFEATNSACTRTTSSKKFERPVYDWIVTGFRLHDLCEQVLPFLVVKKEHCENMIHFRSTYPRIKIGRGNRVLSKDVLNLRQECWERARKLNSRFHLKKLPSSLLGPCCPSTLSSEDFQVN